LTVQEGNLSKQEEKSVLEIYDGKGDLPLSTIYTGLGLEEEEEEEEEEKEDEEKEEKEEKEVICMRQPPTPAPRSIGRAKGCNYVLKTYLRTKN